ncbi:MAG: response regulator [Synechococcales cyanobacterium M58_A2018_015]|nr:response regulator [Synechococcales cyanobacterium M58_A2018_015]
MTKRILIIDDDSDVLAVTQLALKTVGGWMVSTATSGREGIEKAAQEQPDAILLDVMMPDMDGFATLQALQSNPTTQSIPVILMTAKVQTSEQRLTHQGVTATIIKPFKAMKLPAQIADLLGWNS